MTLSLSLSLALSLFLLFSFSLSSSFSLLLSPFLYSFCFPLFFSVSHSISLFSLFFFSPLSFFQGAITIAEGLAENKCLLRLELRSNNVSLAGFLALSHALRVNQTIFKIMLDMPADVENE